jgi:hypothetical protein
MWRGLEEPSVPTRFREEEQRKVVLSRTVVLFVVVMALGIIGVLGAVSSPSPKANDDHNDSEGRSSLTVLTKTVELKVVNLGAQGPSQGDMRVLNAPLYNESGKEKVGRLDLLCVATDPADESSKKPTWPSVRLPSPCRAGKSTHKAWTPSPSSLGPHLRVSMP